MSHLYQQVLNFPEFFSTSARFTFVSFKLLQPTSESQGRTQDLLSRFLMSAVFRFCSMTVAVEQKLIFRNDQQHALDVEASCILI